VEPTPVLELAVRVLAIAGAVAFVCLRLRIPPIAGLLVAGALIGPTGLGWVTEAADVERFAEIGVVLLLFVIGLEFSRERLRELGRPLLVAGPIQATVTIALATTAALAFGLAPRSALVVGFVVCLSSTALLLRIYDGRGELEALHGQAAFGVLIFQDLLVVPLIVVVPLLAGGAAESGGQVATRLLVGAAVLAVAAVAGRWAAPRLFAFAARRRSREAYVLGAVVLCLGFAWLSAGFGLSPALGGLLAGLLLADSEYAHSTLAEVMPLREIFSSLFFLSVGMLVDLDYLAREPGLIVAVTLGAILLKATGAGAAALALGLPVRMVVAVALGLAQIGEFSFVLLGVGRGAGLIDATTHQLLLGVAALTLVATPGLVAVAPWLGARMTPRAVSAAARRPGGDDAARPPVVLIVGYGVNGELLARILAKSGIRYAIVDADPERVRRGRQAGEPIVFGDAVRPEILRLAGLESAHVVVVAISDPASVLPVLRRVRELGSRAQVLVRTRHVREIEHLERAGADRVVAEEYESAIEIYTWTLARLHVPRNVIAAQTRVLRGEDYRMLRGELEPDSVSAAIAAALAAGTTEVFRVLADSAAVGRTLGELDLRRRTGAAVIALVRGDVPDLKPSAGTRLEPGDDLVLVGAHAEIERAFDLLRGAG
jgi:CPA2 family monovalent cation:H+ antiporter-2